MATWELHDGREQIGPLVEEHVLRMIAQGLPETVLIRAVGEQGWRGIRTHAPFAMALPHREASSPTPARPRALRPAVATAVGFAVVAPIGAAVLALTIKMPAAVPPASSAVATVTPAPEESHSARVERLAVPWRAKTAVERETGLRACCQDRSCFLSETAQAIVSAAADKREGQVLVRMAGTVLARRDALLATDGTEVRWDLVRQVATGVGLTTITGLRTLPTVSLGEAFKDPSAARGSTVEVVGDVVQIERVDDTFRGTLMGSGAQWVYFVAVGKTDGIVHGTDGVRFVGVFMQKYWYPNTIGGQTESALLVGRFAGQSDADPPLPGESAPVKTKTTGRSDGCTGKFLCRPKR